MVVFDYYDGPLEGVLACDACGGEYLFRTIAWNPDRLTRVFELRPVSRGTLQRVTEICSPLGSPRWPVWVPRWSFQSEEVERRVSTELNEVLQAQGELRLIVAAAAIDRHIDAARTADAHTSQPDLQFWLEWLGIPSAP